MTPLEKTNKAVVLRMLELVNTHQADKLDEVFEANFVDHGPSAGAGLEGLKKGLQMMHASLPDQYFAAEQVMAEGDFVVLRGTISATFNGAAFFGVPSTGHRAQWPSVMSFRVGDGKIRERWVNADTWGMLQQIGVLPSSPWDVSPLEVGTARDAATEEKNKAVARALIDEVWVKRNVAAIDQFFTPDGGVAFGAPCGGTLLRPDVIKFVGSSVFAAFPDFKATIEYVVAEGDVVALRIAEDGTQQGEYLGAPATNKHAVWSDSFFLVLKEGKIARAWIQSDTMGLMRQIDAFKPAVPAKPQAPAAAPQGASDRNVAAFRRFIEEFWNQRKFEVADEIIAPEHFSSSIPTLPPGPEGMKLIAGVVAGGIFPDLQRRVIELFATEDRAAAVWENSGTHTGTYMNVPGTGKQVKWLELCIAKMKDGKITESWYRPDEVGLLKEIADDKLTWLHF